MLRRHFASGKSERSFIFDYNLPCKTQSLSCCVLSPWMQTAGHPSRFIFLAISSTLRFVSIKTIVLFSCSAIISFKSVLSLQEKKKLIINISVSWRGQRSMSKNLQFILRLRRDVPNIYFYCLSRNEYFWGRPTTESIAVAVSFGSNNSVSSTRETNDR